ncbi:MAG TPA: Fe-S cluster assembly protein IscX [Phycisphaerales bacterium]|nr:Fe-S cluster assembly protein IscX [Phycisphaerales bacterium]
MAQPFGWLDTDDIAELLAERHRDRDPMRLRFTELRALVEALPGFKPDPDHPVNEKILETVQAEWCRIKLGAPRDDD